MDSFSSIPERVQNVVTATLDMLKILKFKGEIDKYEIRNCNYYLFFIILYI